MQLQLTEPERAALARLVHETYAELNAELHRAMGHEYRERVRRERTLLEGLLKRLEPHAVATA